MRSITRLGPSENGGVLFKARTVPFLPGATGQRFMSVVAMLGRFACRLSTKPQHRRRLLRRSRFGTGDDQWSLTYHLKAGDPVELTGYWLEIYSREGGTWKKRVDAWNLTPPPAHVD